MSGSSKGRDQAPSTAEAIRMASASILATTTRKGIPLGSAIGSGRMMEENSEVVAMNVAPLVLSIRDILLTQEGLDLLSLEWDLEYTPGPRIFPEQLTIAGGTASDVGSYVCVLSWEQGVVDPFKIDDHMKQLSKKIADIETVIMNNELDYENEGMRILRRFNDRLNSVVFVEMMDKKFQESWDSFQLKQENVDIESIIKVQFNDDFTFSPPGIKVLKRTDTKFINPNSDEAALVDHFKHRVLTPAAIEALTVSIPETGRAILSELNAFAYSLEESSAAKAAIDAFTKSIEKDEIPLSEIDDIIETVRDFVQNLHDTVGVFEEIVEGHIGSGKTLTLDKHEEVVTQLVQTRASDLQGAKGDIISGLVEQMMESVKKEFPIDGEIRAWQLKGVMRYFLAYTKRVAQYFEEEFRQYLMVSAARELLVTALQGFREEMIQPDMDPIDRTLFEKVYQDILAQMNASFDKKAFEGQQIDSFTDLTEEISQEMIRAFKALDVWKLVNFGDIAEIARHEINRAHSPDTESSDSTILLEMLSDFETLVSDIIPDIAQTLLGKNLLDRVITWVIDTGKDLGDELIEGVKTRDEKPENWLKEAVRWVEEFKTTIDGSVQLSETLLGFLRFVHEKLVNASGARSVVTRVVDETESRESVYQEQVTEWQSICKQIDSENDAIKTQNERRESLLAEAKQQYEKEMEDYNRRLDKMKEQPESLVGEESSPPAATPTPPVPLEAHIRRIESEYPHQDLKELPKEPEPSQDLSNYRELRGLLTSKVEQMATRQEAMGQTFTERLVELSSTEDELAEKVTIGIGEPFHEYLMDSTIRGLGRLFPRTKRAYLRDPERPEILYLVTYEHADSELTVTIGDTYLRGGQ